MRILQLFAALAGLLAGPFSLPAQSDGLFADFQTSMGDFTARLDYGNSPQTVANFVGLATGARPHIDAKSGAVVTGKPFYNGLLFHRVISNFMIQGGCPLGNGSAGPGYEIRDELNNGLTHNQAYLLSMANAGPNTSGSQFFITVAPTPWLDGRHSIFGALTSGAAVVDAINGVPTNPSTAKPVADVTIQSITIRRVGAAAEAFDIHAQNLPVCLTPAGFLQASPNNPVIWNFTTSPPPGSIFSGYRSSNLKNWSKLGQVFRQPLQPSYGSVNLENVTASRGFFHLSETRYPDAHHTASNLPALANRELILQFSNAYYVFQFDSSGVSGFGTYVQGLLGTPFLFTFPTWLQGLDFYSPRPYGFEMVFATNAYGLLRIAAGYDSVTPLEQTGRQTLSSFNGSGWTELGYGLMTLSH